VELFALVPDPVTRGQRLPVDPVCRMAVDPALAPRREEYRRVEYHFCSDACADAFGRDPRRYAQPRAGGLFRRR
jgi:YHS domain-containing protein